MVVIDGRRKGCGQFIWLSVVVVGFKKSTEQNIVNLFYSSRGFDICPKMTTLIKLNIF